MMEGSWSPHLKSELVEKCAGRVEPSVKNQQLALRLFGALPQKTGCLIGVVKSGFRKKCVDFFQLGYESLPMFAVLCFFVCFLPVSTFVQLNCTSPMVGSSAL